MDGRAPARAGHCEAAKAVVVSADTMSPRCLSGVIIRPPAHKHHGEVTGQVTGNGVPSYESTFLAQGGPGSVPPRWPAAPIFLWWCCQWQKKWHAMPRHDVHCTTTRSDWYVKLAGGAFHERWMCAVDNVDVRRGYDRSVTVFRGCH